MGFYQHCDDPSCHYDDPREGRTRLDAPTLRERLTGNYRCWKCDKVQTVTEMDMGSALEELLDRIEALEARDATTAQHPR